MAEIVPVQWFPGHMAKTRRLMRDNLRLVDLVVELTDATDKQPQPGARPDHRPEAPAAAAEQKRFRR